MQRNLLGISTWVNISLLVAVHLYIAQMHIKWYFTFIIVVGSQEMFTLCARIYYYLLLKVAAPL